MCARGIDLAFFLRFFYWIQELFRQCDIVFLFILSVILKYLNFKNQRSDIVFPFKSLDKKRSNRTFNIIISCPVPPLFFFIPIVLILLQKTNICKTQNLVLLIIKKWLICQSFFYCLYIYLYCRWRFNCQEKEDLSNTVTFLCLSKASTWI